MRWGSRSLTFVLLLAGWIGNGRSLASVEHPFLIVDPGDDVALQAVSDQEPYATWAAAARTAALDLDYDASEAIIRQRSEQLTRINQGIALTYLLEPELRAQLRARFLEQVQLGLGDLVDELDANAWATYVPPGNAFATALITADILHPDLSPAERQTLDELFAPWGSWWLDDTDKRRSWASSLYGNRILWTLFSDGADLQTHIDDFNDHFLDRLAADGAFPMGPAYINSRLRGHVSRGMSKRFVIDVLAHTGHDTTLLRSEAFGKLFDFFIEFGATPWHGSATIGDALEWAKSERMEWDTGLAAAQHLDHTDLGLLEWFRDGRTSESHLLMAYVLRSRLTSQPAAARAPVSRIYPSAGAAFWSQPVRDDSLKGQLINFTDHESHLHRATNSIVLMAYGEHILIDPANNYRDTTYSYGDWRDTSSFNNVVQIDGRNHHQVAGTGVIAGFTGSGLDYALGSAGPAIAEGDHERHFLFVHPGGATDGYFLAFDEVRPDDPSHRAHALWHPHDPAFDEVVADEHYRARVSGPFSPRGTTDVGLDIYLVTPPASTARFASPMASSTDSGWVTTDLDALRAEYATDSAGRADFATVLYPVASTHPAPGMQRFTTSAGHGAMLDHGSDLIDRVYQSTAATPEDVAAVSVAARRAWWREEAGVLRGFFVTDGDRLRATDGSAGFTSDAAVTAALIDGRGHIICATETQVTLHGSGIEWLRLDGARLDPASSGPDSAVFVIPAGTHSWQICPAGCALRTVTLEAHNEAGDPLPLDATIAPAHAQPESVGDGLRFEDLIPTQSYVITFFGLAEGG